MQLFSLRSQCQRHRHYLAYSSSLLSTEQYQAHVLIQLSRDELLSAYSRLQWQLFGIVILILLLTLAAALWSARSISQPLIALAQAAQRIGRGERMALPKEGSVAETQQLASTLYTMQEAIAKREATSWAPERSPPSKGQQAAGFPHGQCSPARPVTMKWASLPP